MPKPEFPDLLKHMTLAIFAKQPARGPRNQRLSESFDIARGKLAEWGYLTAPSATAPLDNIRLTAKGRARNRLHQKEQGGTMKSKAFDQLFAPLIEAWVSKKSGTKPEDPTATVAMGAARRR